MGEFYGRKSRVPVRVPGFGLFGDVKRCSITAFSNSCHGIRKAAFSPELAVNINSEPAAAAPGMEYKNIRFA